MAKFMNDYYSKNVVILLRPEMILHAWVRRWVHLYFFDSKRWLKSMSFIGSKRWLNFCRSFLEWFHILDDVDEFSYCLTTRNDDWVLCRSFDATGVNFAILVTSMWSVVFCRYYLITKTMLIFSCIWWWFRLCGGVEGFFCIVSLLGYDWNHYYHFNWL